LGNEGYGSCLNDAATIFAQSSDVIFSKFGNKIKEDIIAYLQSITKLPQKYNFPFYFITKNTFSDLFDEEASEMIMESIRKEILRRIDFDTDGNIEEILEQIQRRDLTKYLKNLSGHEHVLFLWTNKNLRDKIMEKFFVQPDVPQGLISSEKIRFPAVEATTYSSIFANKETATQQEFQIITQIHQKNQTELTTRIAGIDCTQWFKQGLSQEFLALENQIDIYFEEENISCICGYNIDEIPDDKTLKTLLKCHDYVMLDNPHSLFRRET